MKQIKVEEQYNRYYYEATDGTRFESSEECEKWEKSAKCAALINYKEYVINTVTEEDLYTCGSDEYYIDIVKVPTEEVEKSIIQLYFLFNPCFMDEENNKTMSEHVSKIKEARLYNDYLFIGRGYECDNFDCFYPLNTLSTVVGHIKRVCKPEEPAKTEEK